MSLHSIFQQRQRFEILKIDFSTLIMHPRHLVSIRSICTVVLLYKEHYFFAKSFNRAMKLPDNALGDLECIF